MAGFHVSTAGAGSHNGDGEANAFTWAEMVSDLVAATTVSNTYYVKSDAVYDLTSTTTFNQAMSSGQQHFIIGYNSTNSDGWQGYDANGFLDTTNYPVISYSGSTIHCNINGNNLKMACLNIKSEKNSSGTVLLAGVGCSILATRLENISTVSNGYSIRLNNAYASISDCDLIQSGASGGSPCTYFGNTMTINNVRAKSVSGPGFFSSYAFGMPSIVNSVAYECGTHGVELNGGGAHVRLRLINCTIANNTDNGIEIPSTQTGSMTVIGCSITDNGGYAIDQNGATSELNFANIRAVRNNGGGSGLNFNVSVVSEANAWNVITASGSDYNDDANYDFRILQGALGQDTSIRGANIGACSAVPNTSSGSGGLIGYGCA